MGVFDEKADLYETFEATLAFRNAIRGGIPFDPKMIERWILHGAGVEKEEERKRMVVRTIQDIDPEVEIDPDQEWDAIFDAARSVAETLQTQGFKRGEAGLYVESRQVKAMIKESAGSHYSYQEGDRWGPTSKSPVKFLAEHVFVEPDRIYLGRREPDRVDQTITHSRYGASLGYVEAVERPTIKVVFRFSTWGVEELLEEEDGTRWATIMAASQNLGLGADRAMGHGKFEVTSWRPLEDYDPEAWQGRRVEELRGETDDEAAAAEEREGEEALAPA